MKQPNILFVCPDASASTYYRQVMPYNAMKAAGYPVSIVSTEGEDTRPLMNADMLVVSRLAESESALASIKGAQEMGKVVICDYDDLIFAIPRSNPSYFGEDATLTHEIIKACDGVVVTNESLASAFRPYSKNVGIIPNRPDISNWPAPMPREGITIGLTGSPSHILDWNILISPLRAIREKYPHVKFLLAGYAHPELRELATTFIDWVALKEYPKLINTIDIGLCPLIDDQFNRCKSAIKAYELAQSGAAVVGSPIQYRTVLQGRGTIARTESEWFEGISKYIEDESLRASHAASLTRFVRRLDVNLHVKSIASIYAELYRSALR